MYEAVFWPDMDSRRVAVLVGTSGYYYENWNIQTLGFVCYFIGT